MGVSPCISGQQDPAGAAGGRPLPEAGPGSRLGLSSSSTVRLNRCTRNTTRLQVRENCLKWRKRLELQAVQDEIDSRRWSEPAKKTIPASTCSDISQMNLKKESAGQGSWSLNGTFRNRPGWHVCPDRKNFRLICFDLEKSSLYKNSNRRGTGYLYMSPAPQPQATPSYSKKRLLSWKLFYARSKTQNFRNDIPNAIVVFISVSELPLYIFKIQYSWNNHT